MTSRLPRRNKMEAGRGWEFSGAGGSTKIPLLTELWPGAQGVADEEDALGVGHAHFATDDVVRQDVAVGTDFSAAAPNRQRFAGAFHPQRSTGRRTALWRQIRTLPAGLVI
jgi:hypothetical protein